MTIGSTTKGSGRRARVIASLVGGTLAASGVVAVGAALTAQDPAPPRAPREAHPSDRSSGGTQAAGMEWSRPVRVSIPRIDVSSTLEDLALDPQGAMQTPQNPAKAGWFTPSAAPGMVGSSVIAGHVTWDQEPAVFFRLGELRRGDKVQVFRADGTTAVFEVSRVAEFDKRSFPTQAVYGQIGHPGLRLITCGGTYDPDANSYGANLIVWADLVK